MGRLRPTPGRVNGVALVAVLALASAIGVAAVLWARHDDGSSKTRGRTQLALRSTRQPPASAGERVATRPKAPKRDLGARPRPPAFNVAGAPTEPLDEIPLPLRARRLDVWLTAGRSPTAANERHWLYQHAWIVTGARFGWWHGAEALRLLIHVDRHVESRWHIGYRSEAVARRALASVETRTR